eukprot:gb/GECG01012998.1/.p1 GENE.gb/GECG01012998.1/~~gb/GECG01012998.1/.p1  ORF type:complete len:163 (+),score=19.91 gb/GECG01012998.1/:1-489(+)
MAAQTSDESLLTKLSVKIKPNKRYPSKNSLSGTEDNEGKEDEAYRAYGTVPWTTCVVTEAVDRTEITESGPLTNSIGNQQKGTETSNGPPLPILPEPSFPPEDFVIRPCTTPKDGDFGGHTERWHSSFGTKDLEHDMTSLSTCDEEDESFFYGTKREAPREQ